MTYPDPGAQSGTDPNVSGVGSEGDASGTSGEGTSDPAAQSGEPTAPTGRVYTEAEVEAIRKRMQAADQNRSRAEAELAQLKGKDLPEAERLKAETAKLQEELEKANTRLRNSLISNAFLRDNTHEWHDPETALSLLDLSAVDIDMEGETVSGLNHAITALAKAKPFLLKPKPDAGSSAPAGPGGTVPANNGGSGSGKPNAAKLAGRFTAMRGRS